ncbi:LOW QUALITY PROTEIN: FRAS1-related extracellular matrix protein 1-like [Mantella aurantiaca]
MGLQSAFASASPEISPPMTGTRVLFSYPFRCCEAPAWRLFTFFPAASSCSEPGEAHDHLFLEKQNNRGSALSKCTTSVCNPKNIQATGCFKNLPTSRCGRRGKTNELGGLFFETSPERKTSETQQEPRDQNHHVLQPYGPFRGTRDRRFSKTPRPKARRPLQKEPTQALPNSGDPKRKRLRKMSLSEVVLLLSVVTCDALADSALVVTNKGVTVGRGQTAYITENQLRFNLPSDRDSCKVEVVFNEPTTQRVGFLSPQGFDCRFLPDEVRYTHNGSPMLDVDHVMLRVYRFSERETLVESFILEVNITEPLAGIVLLGENSLEVPEFYGVSSKSVDKNILSFKQSLERPGTNCVARSLGSQLGLPAYGQMVIEDSKRDGRLAAEPPLNPRVRNYRQEKLRCSGNKACHPGLKEMRLLKTNCADLLQMGIRYEHLSPPSPDVDYIPLQIEYRSQDNRKQMQSQNIWIPVIISGAVPNTAPRAAFMPTFILEIDQFILTPLTTAALDAEDDETPKNKLVFKISKPPPEGYITHTEDQTKAIVSFTWQDLHDLKIAYQPPNASHPERRNYEVEFQAIDSYFLSSPPITVHFSIRTAETNAPRVSWNMGLDLLEGQSRPITWDLFQIADNDNIQAVRLVTVDGLHHGRLTLRDAKAFVFTVQDIKDGVVRYHHDDSDTTKDFVVFRIFDGKHSIRHKFPINILPKDDSPPFLVNNVGFELLEGASILIEKDMLLATDMDSSDDHILYNITRPPKAGEMVKRYSSESPGVPVLMFMQRDLFRGLIYYRHFGGEIFQDSFEFVLSDSHQPPNYSDKHVVVILIAPVKDQLPREVDGSTRHLSAQENEVTRIGRNQLHFTDTESPHSRLLYTVTKPCYSVISPGVQDPGKLIFVDSANALEKDPLIPMLNVFTQEAVTHLKVAYMPPIQDIGPDPMYVQFEFSVSDEHGGKLTGLLFNITVVPVDDQIPKVFTSPVSTEEGASCLITGDNIVLSDADTKEESLRIILKARPLHGNLEVRGVLLSEGGSFNLEDLRSFRVRYQHDDSESYEDVIIFAVTDGNNAAEGALAVQIIPVNDEPPELQPGLKSSLDCPEGGHIYITAENLYATDPDSDDAKLTYMVARMPLYGMIQRHRVVVEKFTQLDVIQGLITYIHTGGEIGPHPQADTVTLIVSDGESTTADTCCSNGPLPPPIPLHASLPVYDLNITLTPVNNQQPIMHIGDIFVVDEGSSSVVTPTHLNASDVDTLAENLIFFMETQPQFGYLKNTLPMPGSEKSSSEIKISSFSLQHVTSGYIRYIQSHHRGIEPTADFFMISVSDSLHKSMSVPFYIVIKPTNDEQPQLYVKNLTVIEGGRCEIGPATLSAEDLDVPPDALRFTVVTPPEHGSLLNSADGDGIARGGGASLAEWGKGASLDSFTLDELRQGMAFVYTHDDTDTAQDGFTVQLTDGKHTVQDTLYVRVVPVNDEKPSLIRNGGLEVETADNKVISSVVLEAEDRDSQRRSIYYIINNAPAFGELKMKVGPLWVSLYAGMNFTQEDVDMNRVWYFHTTILGCKGHDGFRFYLTDGDHSSPPDTFYISILNLGKGDIVLLTRPVTLTEGDRVTLTTAVLLATDGTGKPERLLYAVSVPPVHGQIEYINYPGLPISSFSQLDVAAQKVCYVHDNSRQAGKESISFTVSNGLKSTDGSLELLTERTDRVPPTLLNNKGLQIAEGGVMVISSNHLRLNDPDSPLEKLHYEIVEYPRHGQLYLGDRVLRENRFTQLDVNNLFLSYRHHGGPAEPDRFSFVATDDVNKGFLVDGQLREDSAAFVIQVEHVDKMPPKIVHKERPSTVENLKDGKSVIQITSRNLKASDPDSTDDDLLYVMLRSPGFGHLENAKTGDHIGRTFTQNDVNQRIIRYVINPSLDVTSDSFEFQVSDPAGNKIPPEILELQWSVIQLAEPYYRACENLGTLAIKLMRVGSSKDPAFIGIKVQELSARHGLDFTHSSASLVQFDPGVDTKTWNVYLKNDGLEENHELFKILLRTPKNAVLGKNGEATVEIMDPRDGQCGSRNANARRRGDAAEIAAKITQIRLPNTRASGQAAPRIYHSIEGQEAALAGSGVIYHGMTQMSGARQSRGGGEVWLVGAPPSFSAPERPQRDSAPPDSTRQPSNGTQQGGKPGRCPAGWTRHQKSCYYLNTKKRTWEEAERDCARMTNSHLTSVQSQAAMGWLWRFANKKPFWIGLRLAERRPPRSWAHGHPWTPGSSSRRLGLCPELRRKSASSPGGGRNGRREAAARDTHTSAPRRHKAAGSCQGD